MARTDTYDKARPFIAEYAVKHGKPPTVDTLSTWFANEHDARPSRETLRRALQAYRDAMDATVPADASALSLAQTMLAHARAQAKIEAEQQLAVDRDAMEQRAAARIDEVERTATVALEKAQLDVAEAQDRAMRAEARAHAIDEQSRRTFAELEARQQTLTNALFAATQALTESLAAREAEQAAARQHALMWEQERHALEAACDDLRRQRTREQGEAAQREQRAHEQFQQSQANWLREISTLRDKVVSLEKALLAARVEKDHAVTQVRREMTEAIANQLKALAVVVGGVNQVHNTHMSGLRTQLEQILSALDRVAAIFTPTGEATPSVLPDRAAKKGRK